MELHRILFIAEGQLGDLLLLTPALRAVKSRFPSSSVSVLVVERHKEVEIPSGQFADLNATPGERESSVLGTNKNVDELLIVNRLALRSFHGLKRIKAELAIGRSLRRRKFDAAICTFPEDRFALWAFASGARVRVGQNKQSLHRLLTHKADIEKASKGVLEYYCALAMAVGAEIVSHTTEYEIPESSKRWADEFLRANALEDKRRIVAIHPGATGNYKIWPPERYAALIGYLDDRQDTRIVLCRGDQDESIIEAIKQIIRCPVVEVETGGDVGRFAAVLQRCALCISNDSGPRHLAVAVGTPTLAFFRQHHDREWGIYPGTETCVTLKGAQQCPVCPTGRCLDKVPEGEKFGSACMRMIDLNLARAAVNNILSVK